VRLNVAPATGLATGVGKLETPLVINVEADSLDFGGSEGWETCTQLVDGCRILQHEEGGNGARRSVLFYWPVRTVRSDTRAQCSWSDGPW
jgi:hypothetical protein